MALLFFYNNNSNWLPKCNLPSINMESQALVLRYLIIWWPLQLDVFDGIYKLTSDFRTEHSDSIISQLPYTKDFLRLTSMTLRV